jgi:RNA polymerase sigma-70 factor (ECF subfamily)
MHDETTLPRLLADDLDAHFELLVRTYQDRLFAFALRLTNDARDAEEATQDGLVRAYRALRDYPPARRAELQLRAWLYRIVLNVVRNQVRRPRLTTSGVDAALVERLASEVGAEQPEQAALRADTRRELAAAIARLPPRYAAAVVLRHVQGLSYAEAAEILEQPVGTTKSDVHRALQQLREALAPTRALTVGAL